MAREVLEIEAKAVSDLIGSLDQRFVQAVDTILNCRGRVVVSGIGKSGHIARKIASTLASTGTPAFFVHPAEASHGDLGMVARDDVFIALSNSGESDELLAIIPLLKRQGAKLVAMTGNPQSALAREADVHLYAGAEKEACPLNLAPTASTTAALALGDALAVAVMQAKGFTRDEFRTLALEQRDDRQQLFALAGIGERDEHVIARNHAEIAMARFRRMDEERRGAGARQGGGNLACDVPRLADAAHHHAAAAVENRIHRLLETLVETADEIGDGLGLDLQHFACHGERCAFPGSAAGAAGCRLHCVESIAESASFPGARALQFARDEA